MPRETTYALAPHLKRVADEFEKRQLTHFRTALGDDPKVSSEILAAALAVTRGLLRSGSTMVVEVPLDGIAGKIVRQFLDTVGPPGRLDAHIELEIARAFALRTDEMAARCLELARIALQISPGEAVLRFLERLGRCYIAGFYPECVIMCRAVLENALVERFDRERKPLPTPSIGKSEMRARLNRAEELGWLTRRQRSDAWSIWERGSKAAHRDPAVTKEAFETIKITIGLLEALYRDTRRSG